MLKNKSVLFSFAAAAGAYVGIRILSANYLQAKSPEIYEYEKKITDNFTIRVSLCANSESCALRALYDLESLIKDRPLINLIQLLLEHPILEKRVSNETFPSFKNALQEYKEKLQENSLGGFLKVANTLNPTELKLDEMAFEIYDHKEDLTIKSNNFKIQDISFHPSVEAKNDDRDQNFSLIIQEYIDLIDDFIATHRPCSDPVSFSLDYLKLQDKLKAKITQYKNHTQNIDLYYKKIKYDNTLAEYKNSFYEFFTSSIHEYRDSAFEESYGKNVRNLSYRKYPNDITPLMIAALRLCFCDETVKFQNEESQKLAAKLIEMGVDVNAKDEWGRTALFYVALSKFMLNQHPISGRGLMTEKLLNAGADPTLQDHLGNTALFYYKQDGGPPHIGIKLLETCIAQKQTSRRNLNVM